MTTPPLTYDELMKIVGWLDLLDDLLDIARIDGVPVRELAGVERGDEIQQRLLGLAQDLAL